MPATTRPEFAAGRVYITRDGRRAVIDQIAPDGVWALIGRCKGKSYIWNRAGRYHREGYDHPLDLVKEFEDGTQSSASQAVQ